MSGTSRGRVTITLGRSGQVVKRDRSDADASFSTSVTPVRMKSSIRDRIGYNCNSSLLHGNKPNNNKRQQGHISMPNGLNSNGRIGKDDLRLKLMRKGASRWAENNGVKRHIDLREKLTKANPPVAGINPKQHIPEPSMLRQTPLARSYDDLRMESMRSSYSPWTTDHNLRRKRSPDCFPSTSSGISPQSNVDSLQRRPYDSVRQVPYVTRDVLEATRPSSTAPSSLMACSTVSTLTPVTSKPVQAPLPSSLAQRASYVGDEQQSHRTVDGLLHALGLGKYAILFKAEEVDMAAMKQMRENDLKELGIPMGPRKKILLALLPHTKRQR